MAGPQDLLFAASDRMPEDSPLRQLLASTAGGPVGGGWRPMPQSQQAIALPQTSMRAASPLEMLRVAVEEARTKEQTPMGYLAQAATDLTSVLGGPLENVGGPLEAMTVFHGTPHKFAPEWLIENMRTGKRKFVEPNTLPRGYRIVEELPYGRFRKDKIGTGEGAAAYGHGVAYVAENPMVANSYMSSSGGQLYKVDLPDEHIEKMLDWDQPMEKQSDFIKEKLKFLSESDGYDFDPSMTGEDVYQALVTDYTLPPYNESRRDAKKIVSNMLASEGIPGIKYLDQNSRSYSRQPLLNRIKNDEEKLRKWQKEIPGPGRDEQIAAISKSLAYAKEQLAKAKEGTSNFVIFEEGTAKIIGKEK